MRQMDLYICTLVMKIKIKKERYSYLAMLFGVVH